MKSILLRMLPMVAGMLFSAVTAFGQVGAISFSWHGLIFTFGGGFMVEPYHYLEVSDKMTAFDPDTKERFDVMKEGDWPEARMGHSACIAGEKVFIFGGQNKEGKLLNDLWEFDINTRLWRKRNPADIPIYSRDQVQVNINNIIYVAGGQSSNQQTLDIVNTIDANNPIGWTNRAPMLEPLQSAGGYTYGGQLYIFGGVLPDWDQETPGKQPSYSANTWRFNPTLNQWQPHSTTGAVPELKGFGLAQDGENNVWVAGGVSYNYDTKKEIPQYGLGVFKVTNGIWSYPKSTDPLYNTTGGTLVYSPGGQFKSTGKGKLYYSGGIRADSTISERIIEYDIESGITTLAYIPTGTGTTVKTDFSLRVFPNPARDRAYLTVTIGIPQKLSVALFDLSGRLVLEGPQNQEFTPGLHTVPLNISGLSPGIYSLRLLGSGKTSVQRLVVAGE